MTFEIPTDVQSLNQYAKIFRVRLTIIAFSLHRLFSFRDSCLLRCASQSSLDESSQKIPRQRSTAGTYNNNEHTNRSFATMNEMRL